MMKKIVIVDYGVGNLHSLKRALLKCGAEATVSEEAEDIENADALVLPGVGSFEAGMRGIKVRGLADAIRKHASEGKPMLGICLGAQIMLEKGYEFGIHKGLGIFSGKVVRFPELKEHEKIPHIGWNKVVPARTGGFARTAFSGFKDGFDAYFVHSYILAPDNPKDISGVTEYGGYRFCSAMKKGNIYACQFHPEKSGKNGLKIIKNFLTLL